jgi:hypothetical protein
MFGTLAPRLLATMSNDPHRSYPAILAGVTGPAPSLRIGQYVLLLPLPTASGHVLVDPRTTLRER